MTKCGHRQMTATRNTLWLNVTHQNLRMCQECALYDSETIQLALVSHLIKICPSSWSLMDVAAFQSTTFCTLKIQWRLISFDMHNNCRRYLKGPNTLSKPLITWAISNLIYNFQHTMLPLSNLERWSRIRTSDLPSTSQCVWSYVIH